jgi:hypothetical protein
MRNPTVQARVYESLRTSNDAAFVRKEFAGFGSCRQVSRALRDLVDKGAIIRIGHGVYAKARPSSISGKPVPVAPLLSLALEALRKLGVKADVGRDEKSLQDGLSTQVPMLPILNVGKRRTRLKISFGHRMIVYEKS